MTASHSLAQARTFLFVPGNRSERFAKALSSGSDVVVLDLEDAVPPTEKAAARNAIGLAWPMLSDSAVTVVLRINAPTSSAGAEDLAWLSGLASHSRVQGIMVPKAESSADLRAVATILPHVALLPLIESAAGWASLGDIASEAGVLRIALGHIDFQADTGIRCSDDEREIDPLRFAIAMHTRLRGLAPAVDGVTTLFDDETRLRNDTLRALRFGFGGKLCIHPRQIGAVHTAMSPTETEVRWAQRVVAADEAAGGAAVQLDGRMIDLPLVLQARRTLARVHRGLEDRRD